MRWAVLAWCAVALLWVAPAAQARTDPRVLAIAAALRRDPLYVSASAARTARPADVAKLRAAMKRYGHPVYVVIAPFFSGEQGTTDADELVPQLRDRVGRDGLYVAMDADGIDSAALASGVPAAMDPVSAELAADKDLKLQYGDPAGRAAYLIALLGGAPPQAQSQGGGMRIPPGVVFGVAALLAFAGMGLLRRRARVRAPVVDVRPRAHAELAVLEERIARDGAPPEAALRAREAAAKALAGRLPVDAVGALALARAGRRALDGRTGSECFFNPLHGAATREVRFTRGREDIDVPACPRCAHEVEHGQPVDAFQDRGRPYWARDTIWARTGFGALDAALPDELLAGR